MYLRGACTARVTITYLIKGGFLHRFTMNEQGTKKLCTSCFTHLKLVHVTTNDLVQQQRC